MEEPTIQPRENWLTHEFQIPEHKMVNELN